MASLLNMSGGALWNKVVQEPIPDVCNFEYTGAVQSLTFPAGTYKLEVWGAQGGTLTNAAGGKGGYSVGTLTLTSKTKLYIYVGGEGVVPTDTIGLKVGGFNGGGNSYTSNIMNYSCGSGGGGSDIRIGTDSLYARVIVAGGGGGAGSYGRSYRYKGGFGGGENGGTGNQYSASYRGGAGGSQTSAGTSYYHRTPDSTTYGDIASFGFGGGAKSDSTSYVITGGGGGWYGGGFSALGGGGGGSGYVYTSSSASNYPSGCLLNSDYYLTDAQTLSGNSSSIPTTDGTGTETGHEGNGYARITKL